LHQAGFTVAIVTSSVHEGLTPQLFTLTPMLHRGGMVSVALFPWFFVKIFPREKYSQLYQVAVSHCLALEVPGLSYPPSALGGSIARITYAHILLYKKISQLSIFGLLNY